MNRLIMEVNKMIELYTGFVGSGKSYHAVRRGTLIADAPAGKRYVVANFPVKEKRTFRSKIPFIGKRFKKQSVKPRWLFQEDLTVSYLIKKSHELGFYGKESQALLIIDEAGIFFNSRDWNVKPTERKDWIKFLSQSRKFGYDVVFIVQDGRMLDRQIRSLAEYEVQHKKMNNWALFKLLPFTAFACVKFWNGMRGVRGQLEMCVYHKGVADRYDTMALFQQE
jgi:zona occludens toxin (predicted ATPase)